MPKAMTLAWEWTVLAAKVEEEVPTLPAVLQEALNSNLQVKIFFLSSRQRYVGAWDCFIAMNVWFVKLRWPWTIDSI